ncbi:uncharacterized protein PAC_14673 [Phialocephala subalpina]|uniref:Uncharacterized protein n=1 Tax=Phialocephala subalpina TaxID=576137 RepID=A0A1L7XIC1_9HELO|nr:uncharacterized protein PAC_14673 [Phialocephala subalpina]
MACQSKYDSNEDSVLGDEEEDAQVKSGPASQEPRPYPLPRGRPSCLNGLRFSMVRDQHPYSSAEIESLIRQYGGAFHDWEKLRRTKNPPPVTLIFGSVPQRPHPGLELTELYKDKGIEWFRDQGFLFIDQKKLFVMIESLSGTTLLRPEDLKRSLDADERLERAEADAKRRRM